MRPYKFKRYYKDGTVNIVGGSASKPEYLYAEFDGVVDWDEYDKISKLHLSTSELLKIAIKCFNKFSNPLNPIVRMEIVNVDTNQVVDFVDNK